MGWKKIKRREIGTTKKIKKEGGGGGMGKKLEKEWKKSTNKENKK